MLYDILIRTCIAASCFPRARETCFYQYYVSASCRVPSFQAPLSRSCMELKHVQDVQMYRICISKSMLSTVNEHKRQLNGTVVWMKSRNNTREHGLVARSVCAITKGDIAPPLPHFYPHLYAPQENVKGHKLKKLKECEIKLTCI